MIMLLDDYQIILHVDIQLELFVCLFHHCLICRFIFFLLIFSMAISSALANSKPGIVMAKNAKLINIKYVLVMILNLY